MSIVSLNGVSYGYPSFDPDSSPFSDGPAPEREFVEQLRDITMTTHLAVLRDSRLVTGWRLRSPA